MNQIYLSPDLPQSSQLAPAVTGDILEIAQSNYHSLSLLIVYYTKYCKKVTQYIYYYSTTTIPGSYKGLSCPHFGLSDHISLLMSTYSQLIERVNQSEK